MKRNYTLIELLTVIAVIAILAGLVMPVTGLVRGRAKRTNCSSNLKQVSMLSMQFSNDRDGQLPMYEAADSFTLRSKTLEKSSRNKLKFSDTAKTATASINANARKRWTAALVRYAKYDMSVFYCPADERSLDLFASTAGNTSYSLNYGHTNRPGSTAGGTAAIKMSAVTRTPAGVIQFAENSEGKLGMELGSSATASTVDDLYSKDHKPHNNDYNNAFLDGHVETLQKNNLIDLFGKNYYQITD